MASSKRPQPSNGYEPLSLDTPRSIVWASTGGEGSGKSTFALGAPTPIFICAFDPFGMDRVGKQFKLHDDGTPKDISIARYPFNAKDYDDDKEVMEAAEDTWLRFRRDYDHALKHARTIIWDREDLAWELRRFVNSASGKMAQLAYGDLNMEYVGLLQKAQRAHVNLGLLRGIREEWISKLDPAKGKLVGHFTGKMIPDGFKKVPDHVDLTLLHFWSEEEKTFITRIGKFTEASERGMDYPNFTWLDMAMAAFPESDAGHWGL